MEALIGIFAFCFGAVFGSFLNVVALRYNTGRTLAGRSSCPACGSVLSWYELIPLLSYIIQRGRCRACSARFSPQYLFAEVGTGSTFAILALDTYTGTISLPFFTELFFSILVFSILLVILIYDIRHKIIPDELAYAFALIALTGAAIDFKMLSVHIPDATTLAAGGLLFLPFFALWFISRGKWIGLGDGKLALGIGWLLGLTGGLSAVVFAFWIGAVTSLALLFGEYAYKRVSYTARRLPYSSGELTMKSEIPFAPFLILAAFLVYVTDLNVLDVVAGLFFF